MSSSNIYTGIWINWSRGPVSGWTLTLPSAEGQLLVAFLAVFVTVTGSRFWNIISFLIHQLRAGPTPGDGRHQQSQVILRNTGSAIGVSWELLSLGWPWRKVATSGFWSLLLLALLGLLHASCWAVAGVFSSRVANSIGKEALIRPQNCGYYLPSSDASQLTQQWFVTSRNLNATKDATTYARLCYGQSNDNPYCSQYVVPQIQWTSDANSTCPFDADFCRLKGTAAAFKMDTGILSSQSVFGFNTRRSDEIGYRKVTTCAPLRTPVGFYEFVNNTSSDGEPGTQQWLRYYLGPTKETNWTYGYNTNSSSDIGGYKISTMYSIASESGALWTPIPQLSRTDADVSLYFLDANALSYYEPVDDPWFSVHIPLQVSNETYYSTDSFIRILGCAEQHQFCNLKSNDSDSACTPLTGMMTAYEIATTDPMGFSKVQIGMVGRFGINLLLTSTFNSVVSELSLQAYGSVWNSMSGPLPNNQWQIEAMAWFNLALAKLQALLVEITTGPPAPMPGATVHPPFDRDDETLCHLQKIQQGAKYTSFSVLGVIIILVVGGFIIIISFFTDTIVCFLQNLSRKGEHKAAQWLLDDKLQLQRMVYEKAGVATWTNCDAKVPITTEMVEHMGIIHSARNDKHPSYEKDVTGTSASPLIAHDELSIEKGLHATCVEH